MAAVVVASEGASLLVAAVLVAAGSRVDAAPALGAAAATALA
jgi:hypothetical protein